MFLCLNLLPTWLKLDNAQRGWLKGLWDFVLIFLRTRGLTQ